MGASSRRSATLAAVSAVLVCLAACAAPAPSQPAAVPPSSDALVAPAAAQGPFPVTKVVDGDTIWVRAGGERVKVRLIGMDTPETVAPDEPVQCYGPEASQRAHELLDGTSVRLELDPSQGEQDRYGRTLAYVWMADGRMLNEVLVREGYAREYTYDDPYRYQQQFLAAQAAAQSDGLGRWSACPAA